MSLIEQAAKRLSELERAGAVLPETSTGQADAAHADVSTPEAYVRAIEARERAGTPGSSAAVPPEHAVPAAVRTRKSATLRHSEAPPGGRYIELDLDRLTARGFVTSEAPNQLIDEFRVIKRPILRNAMGRSAARVKDGNLIMVTSALPGEGKTFTSVNLAISIALELDNTVLLVDGDVAHPQLPDLLGIPSGPGLLDLLTRDDIEVGDTLLKTNIEKLTIMPAGSRHRRATELLASAQMAGLLRDLQSRYPDRIIIFDSPPLLATTEARVLASHMGQIVMVVSADNTTQSAVRTALATVESCEVVLMVLNKARQTDVGTYYGYYGDAGKG